MKDTCRRCDRRADGGHRARGLVPDRHRRARPEQPAFGSSAGELEVRTIASGLVNPWALAFLPDGKMLVTERPGRMRIVTAEGQISPPLKGVPDVWASGQGGLLDVVTDKSFAENKTIYFCFAERTDGGGRTAVARAKLNDGNGSLDDAQDHLPSAGTFVVRQSFRLPHRAGRRRQSVRDDWAIISAHRDQAQNLGNHLGKLIRIAPDGSVPSDNPFVGRADAKPEIWSYGHRNVQALAINPATGELWEIEHGPRGGDEVNIVGKGKNYGWPVIGYGIDYSGAKIHDSTAKDGMEQPVKYWVPSIAPSGMAFYTGKLFPKWTGSLFTRRAARRDAGAADAERQHGHVGGTPAARSQRADPRRPPGSGRRAVAADRQFVGTNLAGGASRQSERPPRNAHVHL